MQEHLEVCKGTENEQRGLKNWDKWQKRVTFWKCMRRRFKDRKKQEKDAQKKHGCEAELRRESADHLGDGPADEQPEASETHVHGEDEGGVPSRRDPPDPDPFCRYVK